MRLSKPLLMDFQKRYLEIFGESISLEEAETELLGIAELVSIAQGRSDEKKDVNNNEDEHESCRKR